MRTSGVPISFTANLRISLMARGALFLKPLQGDEAVNDTERNHSNADNHFAIHQTTLNTCCLSFLLLYSQGFRLM